MKILDFASAPNPIKLRLYCAEKGLTIPFEDIDLRKGEHRESAFLKKNPQGTVPILALDNGTHLTESVVIMEYLEALFPKPCMIGRTPLEQAYTRQSERFIELNILHNVTKIFFHTHAFFSNQQQVPAIADVAKTKLSSALKMLDKSLNNSGFVIANMPTIADCTLFAAFIHAKRIDIDLGAECENIKHWSTHFSQRDSVKNLKL